MLPAFTVSDMAQFTGANMQQRTKTTYKSGATTHEYNKLLKTIAFLEITHQIKFFVWIKSDVVVDVIKSSGHERWKLTLWSPDINSLRPKDPYMRR